MRKNIFGRQFKRDRNERKALFKALVSSLVLNERINTTEEKAKAIKGLADRLVNRVKKNKDILSNNLSTYISPLAFKKLSLDIVSRFNGRSGGYTRIIKMGRRFSDNASMVIMEWTEQKKNEEKSLEKENKSGSKSPKQAKIKKDTKSKLNKGEKKK